MRKVLVIDDSSDVHAIVRARLAKEEIQILSAEDAELGMAAALEDQPDVILLDVDLPGFDGFEVCKRLKSQQQTMEIPIIFLTGMTSSDQKIRGLDLGAVDYITKPFDPPELRARVRAALRTKELLDLLSRKAMVDGLTGLWNRAYFDAHLSSEISQAKRSGDPLSCIMADVDHFKSINDTYGHAYGDETLRRIAQLLSTHCREHDIVCRYGGEEFVIILPRTTTSHAAELAERLRLAIESHPFLFNATPRPITSSFGIGTLTPDTTDSPIDQADSALYQAKRAGRNRIQIATPATTSRAA